MFKRLCVAAVAVASMFVLQGCSASCDDACNTVADCVKKFDPNANADVATCVSECEAKGVCGESVTDEAKEKAALDCLDGIACENENSAGAEIIGCVLKCA